MLTKIQNWGNGQGLRFPKSILRQANMEVGDEVEVTVKKGQIVVRPTAAVRGKYRLADLVAPIPKGYRPQEEE